MNEVFVLKSTLLGSATLMDDNKTLLIIFRNGATYEYGTPEDKADDPGFMRSTFYDLTHAESAGKYFIQNIKTRKPPFPHRRIDV